MDIHRCMCVQSKGVFTAGGLRSFALTPPPFGDEKNYTNFECEKIMLKFEHFENVHGTPEMYSSPPFQISKYVTRANSKAFLT